MCSLFALGTATTIFVIGWLGLAWSALCFFLVCLKVHVSDWAHMELLLKAHVMHNLLVRQHSECSRAYFATAGRDRADPVICYCDTSVLFFDQLYRYLQGYPQGHQLSKQRVGSRVTSLLI